jgi:hypothetical protein
VEWLVLGNDLSFSRAFTSCEPGKSDNGKIKAFNGFPGVSMASRCRAWGEEGKTEILAGESPSFSRPLTHSWSQATELSSVVEVTFSSRSNLRRSPHRLEGRKETLGQSSKPANAAGVLP